MDSVSRHVITWMDEGLVWANFVVHLDGTSHLGRHGMRFDDRT
jgi:hypothetical protein